MSKDEAGEEIFIFTESHDMKKIAVILPASLPVPAIKGGAIETLTTILIDENEKGDKSFFFYIFNNNIDAGRNVYKNTKIINVSYNKKWGWLYDHIYNAINRIFKYNPPLWNLYLKKTIKLLKKESFDEVLVEGVPEQCLAIYKATGIKPILHLHTDLLYKGVNNADRILDSCKKIICVSDYIKSRVLSVRRNDSDKVLTVLNCVDIERFNSDNYRKLRNTQRKKMGYMDSDFVIVFSGRICQKKGLRDLVDAYINLDLPNKKLLLVGGTNFKDTEPDVFYKEIRSDTIDRSDIIMTGFVDHTEIPCLLSTSDLYISPSRYYEAAPLANLEAICMGIPAILSDRGGTVEYSNDNCLVINVDDNASDRIKTGIETVYNHYSDYTAVPEIEKWSSDRFYQNIIEVIR